jgi:Tol biopolymer transport system component
VSGPNAKGIHLGRLDGPSRRLLDADAGGVFTSEHLFFVRQNKILAHEFDAERLELKGSPFQIGQDVFGPMEYFTLSAGGGALAYRAAADFPRQFAWVDRSGNLIATVGDPLGNPDGISYSLDRSQLVFFERGAISSDLWLFDTRRGLLSRFTDEPAEDIFPLWTRSGDHIVYTTIQEGLISLYRKEISTGRKELLIQAPTETFASDTSLDGRQLVYQQMNPKTGWDLWARPLGPTGEPISILQTDADERSARLSPDGRWVAFVSNTSGRVEVYVQPFPGPGRPVPVSTKGGDQPQWRSDGSELFYLAPDGKLMAAAIKPTGESIDVVQTTPLFAAGSGNGATAVITANYAASADGQRFLIARLRREERPTPVRVMLNWRAAAR